MQLPCLLKEYINILWPQQVGSLQNRGQVIHPGLIPHSEGKATFFAEIGAIPNRWI